MKRSRKYLAAAVAAVALSVVGLVVASASQLNVSGGSLFLQNASPCTNATIATTGFRSGGGYGSTWNNVRLVGVPAACAGLPIQLTVSATSGGWWGGGTTTSVGSGTAAAGTVDIGVTPNYSSGDVTGVALLIGGWGVPTNWTGTVISLRSFQDHQYVTAAGTASALISDSGTNGTNQQFDLTINDDGTVSLRARSVTRYVTVDGTNSQLYANSTTIGTSQKFNLITNADGTIALKSLLTGFQVCAEDAGASPLIANRDWIQEWEKFYLIID